MNLFDGLEIYLTEQARLLKEKFVRRYGMDPDLAHVIIENNLPETAVYEIENEAIRTPERDKCFNGET